MKYRIVVGRDADVLEKRVQAAIDTGWEPIGGVSVVNDTSTAKRRMRSRQ